MSDLVVIAFPTEAKAEEVRRKLLAMQKEYLIELGDAVVAAKDDQGRIKLNQPINTITAGTVSGAFWGTLIGLIFLVPLVGAAMGAASGAPRRGFDGPRHQRQMDERNCGCHSAGDCGAIRARAQGHGGQGS